MMSSRKKTKEPELAKSRKAKYDQGPLQKVVAAVLMKEGRVLLAQRKKGDRSEGLWEFPGGKLEPGETPEEGLERELSEEFGIETRVGKFLCSVRHSSPSHSFELLAYEVFHIAGGFNLYDHEDMSWVFPEELEQYSLVEPDAALVSKLITLGLSRKL
jgi:8-oxo-dGTP diphosphatase